MSRFMNLRIWLAAAALGLILGGCGGAQAATGGSPATLVPTIQMALETSSTPAVPSAETTAAATPTKTTPADTPGKVVTPAATQPAWTDLPVIPELSPRAVAILKDGLAKGNNPHVFSKIGDCESQASWFLGDFDNKAQTYSLGVYQSELQPVISYYSGSFARLSLAARPGFSSASLLAPIWADKTDCEKNETPLACEIRLNHPLVAFIMVGSNDATNPKTFEGHMRDVLDYTIAQGVLPVIGTKADNVEGNQFINATIARLAHEYDLPLWNYWRAVQQLPDHGLQADGVHLTFAPPRFDDPATMKKAWPVRNLNALQILRVVMGKSQ